MATPWRSQIKNAVKNLAATVTFPSLVNGESTWLEVSRRLAMFNLIEQQPACFVVQHREPYENRHVGGVPPLRILSVGLWCFARTGGEGIEGDELLDSMFEGIETVFDRPDSITGELTLGGLCEYCNIDRRDNMLIRDPGDIDGQALLVVPLRIVVP